MTLAYSENISYLVGPQWSLGEWFFVIWASGLTMIVVGMFIWWLGVMFFDPSDFEEETVWIEAPTYEASGVD